MANVPTQFGYAMHTNVMATPPTLRPEMRQSVFSKYNITGQVTEFPYRSEDEIFSAEFLVRTLRSSPSPALPRGEGEAELRVAEALVGA